MARAGPYQSWRWRLGLPASAATGNAIGLFPNLPPEQYSTLPASEDVTAVTGYSSSTPLFFGRPARRCIFWTTSDVRWGGYNGAGRPVSSWRWRLGPARFGSYRKPMGVWGCFHIYRPSSVPRFRPRKM